MTDSVDDDVVAQLVHVLRETPSLEKAARQTLQVLLRTANAALEASEFAKKAKLRRAMLHLRPGAGYRQLVVEEVEPHDDESGPLEHNLFSATAFRWVTEHNQRVDIDVTLARVYVGGRRESPEVVSELLGEFSSSESRMRLLNRSATHLLALPIRARPGTPEGMISIEAECTAATGLPFIWPACSAKLELLCGIAAPYLVSLPPSADRVMPSGEFLPVVGKAMTPLIEMLDVFAQQQEPILICGPTGSGKSRLARWCHEHSPFRDKPFEVLDLSAIPEELQLAELFGWRRGAFTGAIRDNVGVIARARGGTLFIDEIGNLSLRAQMGLLHVLEERTYRALGDDGTEKQAEVRFIVGTNEDLRRAVASKRFREDLYYRINVLPIALPALRERPDEIPGWARYLVNRSHRRTDAETSVELTPGAESLLTAQDWPGNLRQLDNIMRRAHALAKIGLGPGTRLAIVLREEHVRRALGYEAPDSAENPVNALLEAASTVVRLAQVLDASGNKFDLDLLEGFKGLVLGAALEKLDGDRDAVFKLLGRERLVVARNHHKALRRELSRAEQLYDAVGGGEVFPFSVFSERDGESSQGEE